MKKSRLTKQQQLKLIEFFVVETTARIASKIVGINKNSATYYFHRLRKLIFEKTEQKAINFFDGKIELDESYFGGRRKGKRGRGAAGKIIVFGILKRGGKVYTQPVTNVKRATLMPIIYSKIKLDSIVYTDCHTSYSSLNTSGFKHFRINHKTDFATATSHINGIENFWSQAKRRLRKFNGVPKENFYLYLRECQWRFNNSCPKVRLRMLKKWAKNSLF